MKRQAAVVGVGESRYYKRGEAKESEFLLACTAIRRAAEDAGLEVEELDGFVSYLDQRNDPLRLSAALGLRSCDSRRSRGAGLAVRSIFTEVPDPAGGEPFVCRTGKFWMGVSIERRVRRFDRQVVLVTGGSRGVGRATAVRIGGDSALARGTSSRSAALVRGSSRAAIPRGVEPQEDDGT